MTRVLIILASSLALALAAYGCGGPADRPTGAQEAGVGSTASSSASPDQAKVEVASRIAREIQARPDEADAILERHGKTREEFEALLYEIAADPDLSRAYTRALGP